MILNSTFLEAVFTGMRPGAHTIITAFAGDPNTSDREQARRNWAGRPWQPGDFVPAWYGRKNSYFTGSSFEPDPETKEQRRRKANFLQMHVAMFDDVGTKIPREKLVLRPSAVTETSPGNYQAFYFLQADDPDTRDREVCERLLDALVESGLAMDSKDPGMKGVTRFARLPVGINGKAKYVERLGHPFSVRCVRFDPLLRYSIAEIAAAYRLDLTPEPARAAVIPITDATRVRAGKRFAALVEALQLLGMYHGSHGTWHEITCPWIDQHTDHADTGAAISEPSANNLWTGGFRCHHGHCAGRSLGMVHAWLRRRVQQLEDDRRTAR